MISFIIPTRDRPEDLRLTLASIGALRLPEPAEVIVIDNASRFTPMVPVALADGTPVTLILNAVNEGAAARNHAARAARHEWLVMLDDDSAPLDGGFLDALRAAPVDVGAVAAEVLLEGGGHEAGGLPEVPIGCGVALRRSVFLSLGGYDSSFDYYAEEYDLAARLLLAGFRVAYDRSFRVLHRKVASGRDFTAIVERLVRNNAWVEQRYAPESLRSAAVASTLARYRAIAEKEEALAGYARGLATVRETISSQARTPMPPALYDRFTGRAHAREHLRAALRGIDRVALVAPGKHETIVREVVRELGVREVSSHADAHAAVIATLSPGPILDAASEWGARLSIPVITPWALAPAAATPYMLRTA
ncbi:MAG TPA: hypothetical protein DEB06_07470 [Phycisphaerales bacterium]|nr:hypothetical protein [Phycisphaerales bacterium]